MTLIEIKKNAVSQFAAAGLPTAELDADCLLQFLLNKDKTFVLMNRDLEITGEQEKKFAEYVEKRKTGLPVAYITHKKEFFNTEFYVTEDVLIPKPDTEILVQEAVNKILEFAKRETERTLFIRIADICTGSGCIAISVVKEVLSKTQNVQFEVVMTDLSLEAISVARKNVYDILDASTTILCEAGIVQSGDHRAMIKLVNGDLLCSQTQFDFIFSNPPYVPHKMVDELLRDGRCEPRSALDGDIDLYNSSEAKSDDGLSIIRRLVPDAYKALNKGGSFLMESGEYQTESVRKLFNDAGFKIVVTYKDLEGQERVTAGEKQ